jgi:phosphoglycolate phosphatase
VTLQLAKFVLFDLDGTLLDSLPGIAFSVNYACRAAGLPEPQIDLRSLLGPPIRAIFSKAVPTDDAALLERLETLFRTSYDTDGWQKTSCFDGAREALEAMKAAGHRLFVISNKPRHISLRILEREALMPLFERIYTRDSRTPPYSSKSEMLRCFLDEYGALSSDCLMVGDTMDDITASNANHIAVALMGHGYGEVPSSVPLRFRLQSFSDLLAGLAKGNTK